ncbi:copper oxidase [Burkholderia sp. SRS-W-2-2016]|uniref:multicopper oxidase family protein n=1 Tax=Burkholderia sp. SRS-W-2-2016 TaxID=1926878 RepID=UPI00094AA345|nr:multicopper oxidase domain-containing protein [Burkholderia sp. SRS-W-2-2016]OLL28164.1 copper oxidase [Burkholderia sp. SRS-W-2-2016]
MRLKSTTLIAVFSVSVAATAAHAQSTAATRSFGDLGDTSDALADNTAASATNGLASILQRLQCLLPLNPLGNSASVTLTVKKGVYGIYNPETNVYDTVSMRSYNGCPTGPTITIKQGATLKLTLKNALGANDPPDFCPPDVDHSTPHCFNHTNIHTHGLHVSPSGNSDNVLLTVLPGATQAYSYKIPATHPSGTFWYHAHLHGSTAIDVASGMAGVLIVRGSRAARNGVADGSADIDTILHRQLFNLPFREHVMLFQQIEYGCFDSASSDVPLADAKTFEWTCPKGATGEIRGYTNQLAFVPDPRPDHAGQLNSTWAISGRYTQINGVVQPVFPSALSFVPAGEIRRLRMVHGGNRDTINVKIVRANLSALGLADSQSLSATQVNTATNSAASKLVNATSKTSQTTTLDAICSGETVKQLEFAEDGITMPAMVEKDVNSMNPGYRSDVLVAFPSPGLYCILDEAASSSATINFRPNSSKMKDRRLLSLARVGPGVNIPNTTVGAHSKYWQYIRDQLLAANANLARPAKDDLASLTLKAFAPVAAVDGPLDKTVPATFDINVFAPTPQFVINGKPYDPAVIAYTGTLGHIDEWDVQATPLATHVFHIHTNPFKIVDIKNGNTSIYDSSGNCTAAEIATGDEEYCNLRGVVRDTLFIKAGYTLVMRTKYEDFTGEFVMHCHILDHEDRGMMENVSIVSPTTALLQRIATPVRLASDKAAGWFNQLTGRKPDPTQLALSAAMCSSKYFAAK